MPSITLLKKDESFIEGRINELRSDIGRSEVIEADKGPKDRAVFGRTVRLYDVQTEEEIEYQLLGPYESEPENGKISVTFPIGQALLAPR